MHRRVSRRTFPHDRILVSGTPASFVTRQATRTIPIVMGSLAANLVETGLIAGLKTAKTLGLTILPSVIARADEIVQ
jgi:hypothetical protein